MDRVRGVYENEVWVEEEVVALKMGASEEAGGWRRK